MINSNLKSQISQKFPNRFFLFSHVIEGEALYFYAVLLVFMEYFLKPRLYSGAVCQAIVLSKLISQIL